MLSDFVCGSRRQAEPSSRRGIFAVALALTLLAGGAGCAPPVVSLASDAEPPGQKFGKTFDRWTRLGRIISVLDLDTPVVFTATMRSKAFQHTYAERYVATFQVNDQAERDKIFERERAVADGGPSFWLWSSCHAYQWNDLRPQAGKWRVTLVDEAGQQVAAESIDLVNARDLTQPSLLGDQLDPYTKLWLVRFPAQRSDGQPAIPSAARKISLRAAGPVGHTDLTWLLQ